MDKPAIWLAENAVDAFRYTLDADEWDLTDDELITKYPDYQDEVYEFDIGNMMALADDPDGGVLYCDITD